MDSYAFIHDNFVLNPRTADMDDKKALGNTGYM